MMTISEKVFIRISVGLMCTLLTFTFMSGMAYQKFNELQVEVVSLRKDFDKYVIDRNLKPVASNDR